MGGGIKEKILAFLVALNEKAHQAEVCGVEEHYKPDSDPLKDAKATCWQSFITPDNAKTELKRVFAALESNHAIALKDMLMLQVERTSRLGFSHPNKKDLTLIRMEADTPQHLRSILEKMQKLIIESIENPDKLHGVDLSP